MKKNQIGFSIFEVVIAIGIISVIGVLASNLLTRTYRTSSNAEVLGRLKQNGETASNTIAEAIRMADSVVCYGQQGFPVRKWIVIRTHKGTYTLFRFVDPVPPTGTPTQNGYIARQENLPEAQLSSFCAVAAPNFTQNIPLTDQNLSTGVSISNGEFSKLSSIVGSDGITMKDTVTIKFDVGQAGGEVQGVAPVRIQTTVQVR